MSEITRIRVEKSEVRTKYIPEVLIKFKFLFFKWQTYESFADSGDSSAMLALWKMGEYEFDTLEKAQEAIDAYLKFKSERDKIELHNKTKEIGYIKYP